MKELIAGEKLWKDVSNKDFSLKIQQKQVDIKIGVDIATLAYNKLVDSIFIITGDSDFVPEAKLARRLGIEIVLDGLHHHIEDSLLEHIDGLENSNLDGWIKKDRR